MEVTRHNFVQTLPLVREALTECKFFAFDCEMTGLFVKSNGNNNGSNKPPAFLDDIEDRYEELLESSNAFSINQFGLSAFIWNDATSSWTAKTFNFYTFPHPFEDWDPRFLSEAGSLQFLASCHFNFNKWIYDGIPYMPSSLRDSKVKVVAEKKRKEDSRPDIVLTKESDVQFVESLIKQVKNWLHYGQQGVDQLQNENNDDGGGAGGGGAIGGGLVDGDSIYSGSEGDDDVDTDLQITCTDEYLQLESVNSFQRALQYQTLRNKESFDHPDPPGFYIERVENEFGRVALKLIRATSAEIAANEAEQEQKRIDQINTAASFCQILELMKESKKPAVGHNLSFDIAYTLHAFAKPLPPTWMEFKDRVKKWFPGGIYDTKYIAEQSPTLFADTSLGEVYKALVVSTTSVESDNDGIYLSIDEDLSVKVPALRHAEGFERYVNAAASTNPNLSSTGDGGTTAGTGTSTALSYAHEAGYDAYMTGSVFARLLTLLPELKDDGGQVNNEDELEMYKSLYNFEAVDDYCWRMNVSRSDMQYAVLWGPDNVLPRTNILYLTRIDPTKFRHGGEIIKKLNQVKELVQGGYIRASVLGQCGTTALLELPLEIVEEGGEELLKKVAAAVENALPGCCVDNFEAYRRVKTMIRAGMVVDGENGVEDVITVNLPAKRPRTEDLSSAQKDEEQKQTTALQAAAENTRCSIM